MKKILCVLVLLCVSVAVNAASFSLDNKKVKGEVKPSAAVYKNIIATGYGLDEEQARANAFKSAIEQYIGVVVDSEAHMENGDLIKDSILTASNGFIQEYKQLSSKNSGGLFEVTVNAVVKSQQVIEKIKSLNIAVMEIKGAKNIQARVQTKMVAKEDAEKMLKKAIEPLFKADFVKELIDVKIDKVDIAEDKEKDGNVPVTINYTLSVNYDVYKNKVAELEQLFKNLGGKLYKRVDFPYVKNKVFTVKNSKKMDFMNKKTAFGVWKKNGERYRLDVWVFPDEWKGIYPFTAIKRQNASSLFDVLNVVSEVAGNDVLWSDNITPSKVGLVYFMNVRANSYSYYFGWGRGHKMIFPLLGVGWNGGFNDTVNGVRSLNFSHNFIMSYKNVGEIKSVTVELESKEIE